ncbi:MAG TPA: PHB depolymerase family esterase [bacterium]|nr:PHB depolymerase family esterase [bacterium]
MKIIFLRALLVSLATALFFAGCSQQSASTSETPESAAQTPAAAPLAPGNYRRSLAVGGTPRYYNLHVPTGYDGITALPLVFVLHGYSGTAQSIAVSTGMSLKADQSGFFVAYLEGTTGDGIFQAWNTGLTPELGLTADDVAFVRELAEQLKAELAVDAKRIYAAGMSNGGFMCHRLAAELPDLLAAVAPVAATIGTSPNGGVDYYTIPPAQGPIPMLIVHGELDPNIPYDGGQGSGVGQLYVKSVADAVAFWTQADSCAGSAETTVNGNVTVTRYGDCAEGSEVRHLKISDGYHEWPTAQGHTGFSATDAIWEFFQQHSL